jgi:hypothetical protein
VSTQVVSFIFFVALTERKITLLEAALLLLACGVARRAGLFVGWQAFRLYVLTQVRRVCCGGCRLVIRLR